MLKLSYLDTVFIVFKPPIYCRRLSDLIDGYTKNENAKE